MIFVAFYNYDSIIVNIKLNYDNWLFGCIIKEALRLSLHL